MTAAKIYITNSKFQEHPDDKTPMEFLIELRLSLRDEVFKIGGMVKVEKKIDEFLLKKSNEKINYQTSVEEG